ncbi:MAG: BatA domain-containing protein, partial [Candidatus Binatia bacterium]
MELLNPAALWWLASLPLLLIPYLIRERPHRRIVPALFLFHGAEPARRMRVGPRLRLRPIFLLQLLILLLAVAALARPVLQARTTRSALVIDDSASLGAADGRGRTRFDLLKDAARAAITSDSSAVWDVYTLAPRPAAVSEGADRDAAVAAVDALDAGSCPDPDDGTLRSFLETLAGEGYMRIHVLTDRPAAAPTSFGVRTLGEPAPNLALTGLELRPRGFGSPKAEAVVSVAAYTGEAAAVTVVVEDSGSGERLGAQRLEI